MYKWEICFLKFLSIRKLYRGSAWEVIWICGGSESSASTTEVTKTGEG